MAKNNFVAEVAFKDYIVRVALPKWIMLEAMNHVGRVLVNCVII